MTTVITLNIPNIRQLQKQLARTAALSAARAGAAVVKVKVSGEGSGVKYADLPRRSSAFGEYPAEQSSKTKESIKAQMSESGISAEFGTIDGPSYTAALLFKPPSDGGRPYIDDAFQDRDVRQAVIDGFRDALK